MILFGDGGFCGALGEDAPSAPSLGVHLTTRCATTSNLTEYCAATCAHACAKPSNDITFGASERDPAPVLHLAKMTAAHASAHLALMSPHARIVTSHASGFMPCFDPANFSNDSRSARR